MFAGEEIPITITALLPDGSTPMPLGGRTLTLMVKKFSGLPDAKAVVTKTSHGAPGGIIVTNAPGGIAEASLVSADTEGLSGTFKIGVKVWPSALDLVETDLVITTPTVGTTIAP